MIEFEDLGESNDYAFPMTAEEWFESYPEAHAELPVMLSVRSIDETEYGYRFMTDYFTLFCSFRFRRLADKIKHYMANVPFDKPIPTLCVRITGQNSKGYIDWTFGQVPSDQHPASCAYKARKTAIGRTTKIEFYAEENYNPNALGRCQRTQSPQDPLSDYLEEVNRVKEAGQQVAETFKEPPARKVARKKG